MSRLFNSKRIRVHMGERALAACELTGRARNAVVSRREVFAFGVGERAMAMDRLAAWLIRDTPNRSWQRPSITWVIGHAKVRYLLLSWSPAIADPVLRDAYARARSEQLYGPAAGRLVFCFADADYGQAQLAACIPLALVDELRAHAASSGCRLAGIEPAAAVVWEAYRGILALEGGALCVPDGDRQILLQHERHCIRKVSLRPFNGTFNSGRLAMRRDENLRWFPGMSEIAPTDTPGVLSFPPETAALAAHDPGYAFALCGALT